MFVSREISSTMKCGIADIIYYDRLVIITFFVLFDSPMNLVHQNQNYTNMTLHLCSMISFLIGIAPKTQ